MKKIIKRDGRLVDFDQNKIIGFANVFHYSGA